MEKYIPLSVPNLTGNELNYVTQVVQEQWVSTAGSAITDFERLFAEKIGINYACACQSGTAGLHLCLHHYGIGANDIVLVPTLTFIATINAIRYRQAIPVFFDCDEAMCINVEQVRTYLKSQCTIKNGLAVETSSQRHVKAIIPVHIFGDLCNMDVIMELADEYNLIVIEDATESLGSTFGCGKNSGTIGHAGVFSFNGNKIITTGGGGMIVSNSYDAIEHMRYLSQQAKDDKLRFIHNDVGYNYRMTNLQAALGLAQLEQLDSFVIIKRRNYAMYQHLLSENKVGRLHTFRSEGSNKWFYSFILNQSDDIFRDELIAELEAKKIQTRPIWMLNHLQKPFRHFPAQDCQQAMKLYKSVVNIPCSTNLTPEDISRVCHELNILNRGA